jgi:hypothetical protein
VLSCLPAQFSVTEVEQRVYAKAKKGFDIKGVDKRILDRHMGRLDTFVKWLDVAILTKSWDKITLYAKGVETFCELLISRNIDIANVPQDFFEMDLKLQEARDFLIEASEKKDLKALREEFKRMRVTCKKCHAKYKEDLKEGK